MRRFSSGSLFGIALILFFTLMWSACGGSSSSNSSFTITKFVFAPSLISLEPGQVATISATPYNSSGTVVSATVTYSTSDTKNADITQGGSLCAGQWDNTHTVCTPSYQSGQFTVTATANGATGKATVYVHYRVDAVYLHGPGSACTTMGKTAGLKPYACTTLADSRGTCTVGTCADNTSMCDITDQIGGFNYNVLDSTVATIDSAGTLTAGAPGVTKVYASVSSGSVSTTSSAIPYTTCLVDKIALTVQNATDTSVSVAKGSSATLQATVTDTAGNTITPSLQFNNTQSVVGTLGGSTGTATYTGAAPGYGSVVASCTPPNCNKNASAIFSNVVTTTVTNSSTDSGVTANDTNIYVTGTGASQMYPVDSKTYTLGTVISLPFTPNSILMSHDGGHIFLGSDTNAMVVATASNSVSSLGFAGKALAESPNNAYVIFAGTKNGVGAVNIMSQSSLTVANLGGFTIPNVTAASFTPDGNTVYFSDGSNLYRYRIVGDSGATPTPVTTSAAKDLATSANGTILFSATGASVVAGETCNATNGTQYFTSFQNLGTQSVGASALAAIPNGTGVLAVNGTQLEQVTVTNPNPLTTPFSGCPISNYSMTSSAISFSAVGSGFTVNKLVMSHSGHWAAVLANTGTVGIVDLTKGTVSTIALTNKGSGTLNVYSGDFLLDDSGLWVGANDGYIHFLDISKLADTQQVQVQIQGPTSGSTPNYVNPNLVAVQPK